MTLDRRTGAASLDRGLELLSAILKDRGATSATQLAEAIGLPASTAQRLISRLLAQGFVSRAGPGRYLPGVALLDLSPPGNQAMLLGEVSRAAVKQLARTLQDTVHLGMLDGGMVTYLVKEHGGGAPVLTREHIQLEAYCSGIGKVLLAHMTPSAQDDYLAAGPFVALTARTTVDPGALRQKFEEIRARGYAVDDAELEEDLYCLAVPVYGPGAKVVCALSVSRHARAPVDLALLKPLRDCADRIGRRLGAA